MNKKIKSIFSLAIAVCMLFSIAAFNVSAASVEHTVTITPSVSTGAAGDEVMVNLYLDNTTNIQTIGYKLTYDTNVFEINAGTNDDWGIPNCVDEDFFAAYFSTLPTKKFGDLTIGIEIPGQIAIGGARSNGISAANNTNNMQIGGFILKVKDDAPEGETQFNLIDTKTSDAGEDFGTAMAFEPVTFTVQGAPEVVDTSALEAAIGVAQGLLATVIGDEVGEVSQDAWNALDGAIGDANVVFANEDATQGEVDQATSDLNTAIAAFKAAIVKGATIAVESKVAKQGEDVSVDISVKDVPNDAAGLQFGMNFDKDVLNVVNIARGSAIKYDSGSEEGISFDNATGKATFAGLFDEGAALDFSDYVVVATITFKVASDAALEDTTLELVDATYDDTFTFDTPEDGVITVEEEDNQELKEARDAVKAFEDAVDEAADLNGVATAEGLRDTAQGLVDVLDHDEADALDNRISIADGLLTAKKTQFTAEKAARDLVEAFEDAVDEAADLDDVAAARIEGADAATAVGNLDAGAVKTELEGDLADLNAALDAKAEGFALADINSGDGSTVAYDELVNNADPAKEEEYNNAAALVKFWINDDAPLAIGDIEDIVTAVNAFDSANKGALTDKGGVLELTLLSADRVRTIFLTKPAVTIDELLRADMNDDGNISGSDVTAILKKVAQDMLTK
ncbi:MAG: cohesin domain-containing protein [Firmicutes bacterium]|nr:cohesin domain-containing protein [Bacillota bacterium]